MALAAKGLTLAAVVGMFLAVGVASPVSAASTDGPSLLTNFAGPFDPTNGPPDATLAAAPTRIVELVNSRYAIVNREGLGVTGPIRDLVGASQSMFLSDPQVAWDPGSSRFYYSIFENRGASSPDEGIAWGFSKSSTPNSVADWCHYFSSFNYGSQAFPDRPSLGLSADFIMFVAERFGIPSEDSEGVDLAWVKKPHRGKQCPQSKTFKSGITHLTDGGGDQIQWGTAAREVDTSANGWVVAQPAASAANLLLYKLVKSGSGATVTSPVSVAVPAYSPPPPAPQAGLTTAGALAPTLETKGYLTQAYAAFDPRLGHTVIWTAHGVAGGAGAAMRSRPKPRCLQWNRRSRPSRQREDQRLWIKHGGHLRYVIGDNGRGDRNRFQDGCKSAESDLDRENVIRPERRLQLLPTNSLVLPMGRLLRNKSRSGSSGRRAGRASLANQPMERRERRR
jgi:hypothetical protein